MSVSMVDQSLCQARALIGKPAEQGGVTPPERTKYSDRGRAFSRVSAVEWRRLLNEALPRVNLLLLTTDEVISDHVLVCTFSLTHVLCGDTRTLTRSVPLTPAPTRALAAQWAHTRAVNAIARTLLWQWDDEDEAQDEPGEPVDARSQASKAALQDRNGHPEPAPKGDWQKLGDVPMNVKFARAKEEAALAPKPAPSDAPIEVALGLEEGDGLPVSASLMAAAVGNPAEAAADKRFIAAMVDTCEDCGSVPPSDHHEECGFVRRVVADLTTFPAPPGPLVRNMEAPHGEPLPDRFETGTPGGEGSPARDPRIDPAPGDVVAWGDLPEQQATVDGVRERHFEGGRGHTVLYTDGAGVEFNCGLGTWRSRLAVGRVVWQPEQGGYPPSVALQLAQAAQEFLQGEGESPKPDPDCWAEKHGPRIPACTCYPSGPPLKLKTLMGKSDEQVAEAVDEWLAKQGGSTGRVPVTDEDFAELSADVARGAPEAPCSSPVEQEPASSVIIPGNGPLVEQAEAQPQLSEFATCSVCGRFARDTANEENRCGWGEDCESGDWLPPKAVTVTEDVEVAVRASKVPCPSCKRVVAAGERFTRVGKTRRHFSCVPVKEGATT